MHRHLKAEVLGQLGLLFLLGGCTHPRGTLSGNPMDSGPRAASGSTSVVFVQRENPGGPKTLGEVKISRSMTGYVPPQPIEPLLLPVYPARALAARLGTVRIAVRI